MFSCKKEHWVLPWTFNIAGLNFSQTLSMESENWNKSNPHKTNWTIKLYKTSGFGAVYFLFSGFWTVRWKSSFWRLKLLLYINSRFACFQNHITWSSFKGIHSPNTIKRNPLDYVPLSSVAKFAWTQSNRSSSIGFDLLDWALSVQKSNSHKVWCLISFKCRTQSNSVFDWVQFLNRIIIVLHCTV